MVYPDLPSIPKNLKKRDLFLEVKKYLDDSKAILLLGSRRTGKTSLLYLLLDFLKKKGIPPKQTFFFDLENQLTADTLNQIKDYNHFPDYLASLGADLKKRVFVFLDEVQYLNNPSGLIKYLVDHFPNLKFIVTGSASLLVRNVFKDSMVGRVWRFSVRPLSFCEFLRFKEKNELAKVLTEGQNLSLFQKEFEDLFGEFCLFGGYPEVVLNPRREEKKILLNRLYSDYLRKDIGQIEKIREISAYNNLIRLLAGQVGQLVSDSELSGNLKISRVTVNRFLFLLNETFIIKVLSPYSTNPRQEIIKAPKIYFEDTGLINLLIDSFGDFEFHPAKGSLVENFVLTEFLKKGIDPLFHLHFWRTKQKQEVDFVIQEKGKPVPYEVKYQTFSQPKIPSGLRAFIRRYKPLRAYVVNKNLKERVFLGKTEIFFLAPWEI
ncbi:MAG: ATP-binding protein [Microgenomates group bacterium]